jgi:hypothetical protein
MLLLLLLGLAAAQKNRLMRYQHQAVKSKLF